MRASSGSTRELVAGTGHNCNIPGTINIVPVVSLLCHRPFTMSSCLALTFKPELANANNLKLHIVGAVYGANLAWAIEHNDEEPPLKVVRPFTPRPCYFKLFCEGLAASPLTKAACSQSAAPQGKAWASSISVLDSISFLEAAL